MKDVAAGSFGAQLKQLREAAGFTQEELATIAGLSVHAISALERGERRRPHVETVRALSAALDLSDGARDALVGSARPSAPVAPHAAVDELSQVALLPLAPTMLLGRAAEMQTLRQWLGDPAARLITLVGPGGVGKTRLALEIAHVIAAEGATRVVFVPLATTHSPALVGSAIAEALGLSDVSPVDLPKRVRLACGERRSLLVLDNFEQVLDAASLVAELLTAVAALQVLTTSRAALRVRGEREFAVEPLALDPDTDAMSAADLARAPAVRLFVERVRDVQPGFRLTAANGAAVSAICRRLDALPLALELAAPWLKVLTVTDLLAQLANDVLLSAGGPRDLPERQQTMNATVAWSYRLLTPAEQRLFRRLGALEGRFSIATATAVLAGSEGVAAEDEALRGVAALIDKSLLLRAETSTATRPLYRMLETVRVFAALELVASGERDEALAGLTRHCVTEASLAWKGLAGLGQVEWLDRVRDDLDNYRGALKWLIEHQRSAEASNMAWELSVFWMIRGRAAEGLQWYLRILDLPSIPPSAEAKARYGSALMWYTQGDLSSARGALDRTMALAEDAGDDKMIAQASNLFGHVEHAAGDLAAARERFTTSVAGFRTLKVPWGIGSALTGMAAGALASGDPDQAALLIDEATTVLRNSAGPWFLSLALYVRAILSVRRGSPDEAIALMRESLMHIRKLHDKFAFVYALVPLAAAAALKGDDVWAARILGARDAVTERTGATVVDPSVNDIRDQAERDARQRLGPPQWARAYAAGRTISIDGLLQDIDSVR